jgi:hypothetical protein
MDLYYVNKNPQDNGDHEVHKSGCDFMPLPENQLYLGVFSNCHEAVGAATRFYALADGCHYCCPECDKR